MKKIFSLTLALALMAALFTGCGCANVSTHPGGMITQEATRPIPPATASEPTTQRPMDTTGAATPPTATTLDARPSTRNTDR